MIVGGPCPRCKAEHLEFIQQTYWMLGYQHCRKHGIVGVDAEREEQLKIHFMTQQAHKLAVASSDATVDSIDIAVMTQREREERKQRPSRHMAFWVAVCVAFIAGLALGRRAHADDIVISGGTLLNNHERNRSTSPYVEISARMETDFKGLEVYGSFTHVFQSAFGGHEGKGSAQLVSIGLMKPWRRGDWEFRAGFGLLAAVHYDWGSHYDGPMTRETYKAECLACGWTVPVTITYKDVELSLTYVSTDPNFWTSWNGARLGLGWRL